MEATSPTLDYGTLFVCALMALGALMLLLALANRPSRSEVPAMPLSQLAHLDPELQALIAQDKKIEAIKRVREAGKVSLKEAKDYVESLAMGKTSPMTDLPTPTMPPTPALKAKVRELLAAGKKIEAIKMVRDESGMGLKEAKEYVEAIERTEKGV